MNPDFTKNESKILENYGFSLFNHGLMVNEFGSILKKSNNTYDLNFKYPDGSEYKELSSPAVNFKKL